MVGDVGASGTYDRLGNGCEHEPVPPRHPGPDGAERWEVCARVDVDGLQFPDLVTVGVNNGVATPLPDIGRLDHAGLPLRSIAQPLPANPEQCRIRPAYPELWRRFTITVRQAPARRAGLTNKAFAAQVRLSHAKVAEYQPRGVVHFHAIIRPWPWKLWEHGGARSWPARAWFAPYGQPTSFAAGDPPYQDVRDRCPRCRLSGLWVIRPTGSEAGCGDPWPIREQARAAVTAPTEIAPRDWSQIMAKGDAPVLEVLADINAVSLERTDLDPASLILVRLAALVAVDAPAASYLAHIGPAAEVGVTLGQAQDVLVAVAPIVGTPRTLSAAAKIVEALGLAIDLAETGDGA